MGRNLKINKKPVIDEKSSINIRVSHSLKTNLSVRALTSGLTLTEYIELSLQEHCKNNPVNVGII